MKWFIKCLKQYADFNGRARRKEYWWFMVINFIITMVLLIGMLVPIFKLGYNSATGGEDIDEMEMMLAMFKSPFLYIYILYYLAVLIPGIAVLVRRLHDTGKSGFWAFFVYGGSLLGSISSMFQETNLLAYILLALAALVICIISLVWMFTNSDYGPNQYGPNPKDEGNPTEEVSTTVE